jgi:hypothetical protein
LGKPKVFAHVSEPIIHSDNPPFVVETGLETKSQWTNPPAVLNRSYLLRTEQAVKGPSAFGL